VSGRPAELARPDAREFRVGFFAGVYSACAVPKVAARGRGERQRAKQGENGQVLCFTLSEKRGRIVSKGQKSGSVDVLM